MKRLHNGFELQMSPIGSRTCMERLIDKHSVNKRALKLITELSNSIKEHSNSIGELSD